MQLQLELDATETEPRPGELQRLGATPEFGSLLLNLLSLAGWSVAVAKAFAGEGVLVLARKGPFEARRTGATVGELAADVFREARMLEGAL